MANELLARAGGLHGLARCDAGRAHPVAGVGDARAAQILAALELGRRTLVPRRASGRRLRTPRDAGGVSAAGFGAAAVEQFGVVMLDTKHRVIRTTVCRSGTLNTTVVEPREVFREATLGGAAAIVVFHNHPSGDPTPSPDDVALTRRLVAAGT